MSNARPPYTPETSSPFGPQPLDTAVLSDTSPLLQREGSKERRSLSRRWPQPFAASALVEKNAGLLLVGASQFFFAASNVTVKWLNSLDEHVPILEVRGVRGVLSWCSQ